MNNELNISEIKKNIDDINFLEIDLIIKDEENLINLINPILNEKY